MSTYEVGELVDVTIRRARVASLDQIGAREIMRVTIGQRELELPLGTGIQVTRVAPREWPPQPGDIWDSTDSSPWGGPWFVRGDNGSPRMVPENMAGPSEPPEALLRSVSGLKLIHRRGWTPEAPADHAPEKLDQRAEVIAGLREMADWYEANPDVPMRPYGFENLHSISTPTEESDRAELFRIAGLFGEDPDLTATHPCVRKTFRGGVGVRAYYIPVAETDNDIAPGEGVGASAGVTGAPTAPVPLTAPTASPLPRLVTPAPITDPALRGES